MRRAGISRPMRGCEVTMLEVTRKELFVGWHSAMQSVFRRSPTIIGGPAEDLA